MMLPGLTNAAPSTKPNIIYVLVDDMGYGDLACFGQKKLKTPHLDAMAASGLRFTNHYAGSTVCAPSRCVLMTGLHTGHCTVRSNGNVKLAPEDITVAHQRPRPEEWLKSVVADVVVAGRFLPRSGKELTPRCFRKLAIAGEPKHIARIGGITSSHGFGEPGFHRRPELDVQGHRQLPHGALTT